MNDNSKNESETVLVHRVGIGHIVVYDVKEEELQALEQGGDRAKSQFGFGRLLISAAITSLIAIITTKEFKYEWAEVAFWVFTMVGFVLGSYMLWEQRKSSKSNSELANNIRSRRQKNSQDTESHESQDDGNSNVQ